MFRRFLFREGRGGDLRESASRQTGFARGTFPICFLHDALFRAPGCRKKAWTKQLHLRRVAEYERPALLQGTRPERTGFDSIGDFPQAAVLGAYLNRLEQEKALPKTIIYNVNPADNYAFAAMAGNFQDGSVTPGKMQFGSGWWFLDQKEGMEWQLNALSNIGLLSRFVGMVTDSRSFMSYPRHEYFRRVVCNLIGRDVENGELPGDDALLGSLIRNICYANAERFMAFAGPDGATQPAQGEGTCRVALTVASSG